MILESFSLKDKCALVTGSTRGLGYVFATALAQAGAHVILNGRNEDKLKKVCEDFNNQGLSSSYLLFDVCDEVSIAKAEEKIREQRLKVDVLINNAGINLRGPLEQMEKSTWDQVVSTNLTAPWLVSKYFVRSMLEQGAGKIVNIASLMSFGGRETTGPYTASKGGVALLTKAMAVEWGGRGIQCNAIAPGYFLTDMTKPLTENPDFDGWVKLRTPAARWGNPTELTGCLVFLSSAASSFVNGQVIYVDGGWSSKL